LAVQSIANSFLLLTYDRPISSTPQSYRPQPKSITSYRPFFSTTKRSPPTKHQQTAIAPSPPHKKAIASTQESTNCDRPIIFPLQSDRPQSNIKN